MLARADAKSTLRAEPAHLDEARDLEPKICDVAKQARAVEILINRLMDELRATKAIPQNDIETYLFATSQLRNMANGLKATFYTG